MSAIEIFQKVNPCDPNYPYACYEIALTLDNQGDYKAAMKKCQEALSLDSTNLRAAIMKGSILDELHKTDEAIAWLNKLEANYPYNQNLLYNLAICYINNNQPETAEKILIRALHINPYHTSSHLALARVNYIMGRKAQSYLAYNMSILMNPSVRNIKAFEEAISGQIDSIAKSYLYVSPTPGKYSKWDNLTGLLNSELAFKTEFPYNYKFNFLFCRESYLLFQKMNFNQQDTSFYNQFYVRFFKDILAKKEFETYLYYALKHTNNETVGEWINKNESTLNSFVNRAKATIELWKEYGFSATNEFAHQKIFHFDDQGNLQSYGILQTNSEPSKEGEWKYISDIGAVSQIANYHNNLIEGESTIYWPEGKIKQKLNFKHDKLDGINKTYYPNGNLSGIYPRNNGTRDGNEKAFNTAADLTSSYPYDNGSIDGIVEYNNWSNGYSRKTSYHNNKPDGEYIETWLNSNVKTEATYKDSLLVGSYKTWYANGKPEWEGNYEAGTQTGKWTSYYGDGTKKAEGTVDKTGNPTGTYTEYNHSGEIKTIISGYRESKADSIQTFFFPDGQVQANFKMHNGDIVHLDCYDTLGKQLYSADEKEGKLNYKFFYPNGQLKLEGSYLNGNRDGIWKWYDALGKVESEESWEDGLRSGIQKYYHDNGTLKLIYQCDSDKITGKLIRYFQNGHTSLTGYYDENGYTGLWTTYFSNDTIESKSFYKNNTIVGRRFNYAPDGKLVTEETFNDDGDKVRTKYFDVKGKMFEDVSFPDDSSVVLLHFPSGKLKAKLPLSARQYNGIVEFYYPNGQLLSQEKFIYGNRQGISPQWDHHGNLEYLANYEMNDLDGKIKKYEDGKLVYTDSYMMDTNHGLYKEYHSNGHLFRTITDVDDNKQGTSDYFTPDSIWIFSFHYTNDAHSAVSYRDKQGKMHNNEPLKLSTQTITCYFPNGKIAAQIPFSKGIYNGKYSIYYTNENPMFELNYTNDYREGLSKYYYENGSVKEISEWHNGKKTGNYTNYYENGKKKSEGNYLANQKVGKWMEYDESGKLKETLYYSNDELYEID